MNNRQYNIESIVQAHEKADSVACETLMNNTLCKLRMIKKEDREELSTAEGLQSDGSEIAVVVINTKLKLLSNSTYILRQNCNCLVGNFKQAYTCVCMQTKSKSIRNIAIHYRRTCTVHIPHFITLLRCVHKNYLACHFWIISASFTQLLHLDFAMQKAIGSKCLNVMQYTYVYIMTI